MGVGRAAIGLNRGTNLNRTRGEKKEEERGGQSRCLRENHLIFKRTSQGLLSLLLVDMGKCILGHSQRVQHVH